MDFLFRDANADLQLVILAPASSGLIRERLRLLFSARAAMDLGIGPVSRGWLVPLDAPDHMIEITELEAEQIEPLFQELLNT